MISDLVGLGLYSIKEASILTGISTRNIDRWLYGYKSGVSVQEPLWKSKVQIDDTKALSFHDLLEIRFVDAFRKYGVSLQAIRMASKNARELYEGKYPFTCKHFQTDGKDIFAKVYEEIEEQNIENRERLMDLAKKQYVFKEVISPSLYAGIEFDQNVAVKWYPNSRRKSVVLDPNRSFGKPIVESCGIPTSVLYESYCVEQKESIVADIFDVPLKVVHDAIAFEQSMVV